MPAVGIIAVIGVIAIAYFVMSSGGGGIGSSSSSSGGNLSYAQIASYAASAGFSDTDTAAAIALAESSGNPNALGDPTLGVSVGLWQINLKAHPEYTQAALLDPETNANAAYAVYQSQGWGAWTTYNTNAYLQYSLNQNQNTIASAAPDTSLPTADDSSNDVSEYLGG